MNKNYSYQIQKFEDWNRRRHNKEEAEAIIQGKTIEEEEKNPTLYKKEQTKTFTNENIEKYINHLKENNYASNSISIAVQALRWKAKQLGIKLTIDNFKKPQFKPYDFISEEEVKQLLRGLYDTSQKLLLLLCYDCGLTLKDIQRLRHKDILDDVIKTNSGYVLYSPLTRLTLQAYLQENDGLSDKDRLFQISYDQLFVDLKRLNKQSSNKEINIRNLRLSRLEEISRRGVVAAVI